MASQPENTNLKISRKPGIDEGRTDGIYHPAPDLQGKGKKQACIRWCFEMAKLLDDDNMQRFLLSGMLVFADKVITAEDSKQIKEWIMMTKVGQLFEEEKIQYGKEIEKNVTQNVTRRKELEFTEKMLCAGLSVKEVSEMMTVLTLEDVREIAGKIRHNSNTANG